MNDHPPKMLYAFILEDSLPDERLGGVFREYIGKIKKHYGLEDNDLKIIGNYSTEYKGLVFLITQAEEDAILMNEWYAKY